MAALRSYLQGDDGKVVTRQGYRNLYVAAATHHGKVAVGFRKDGTYYVVEESNGVSRPWPRAR